MLKKLFVVLGLPIATLLMFIIFICFPFLFYCSFLAIITITIFLALCYLSVMCLSPLVLEEDEYKKLVEKMDIFDIFTI